MNEGESVRPAWFGTLFTVGFLPRGESSRAMPELPGDARIKDG
jgi:hypothetical protein